MKLLWLIETPDVLGARRALHQFWRLAELDCALLMRGIAHEWHSRPDLYLRTWANGYGRRSISSGGR